jgi:alpha-mannosidase
LATVDRTLATLVPHTHWDREWYDPFDVFRDRLVQMMDTLIRLGEEGSPHFHLDGQTAMIRDYLAVRPERELDIRRLAGLKALSLGPWFTQMDEFLTSGESTIRNIERGLSDAEAFGEPLHVGYMPDQFGHIGQLPQILRMHGIDRAVVWRGVPSQVDKDAFWWESPDGSRVLTEYMAFGYFNSQAGGVPFDQIEDPAQLADAIETAVERQRSFMASDRMLIMLGYDHAGPHEGFPDKLQAASPHLKGITARIGSLGEHLANQTLQIDPPIWRGELRSSARAHLLPNVYSARVHQKRERGRLEALIERYAEPLAAQCGWLDWPARELDRAWQLLLWNGAHDSVCGCSHDQVAVDVDERYREVRRIADAIIERSLTSLGSRTRDAGIIRFNPSPFDREGVPADGWRVVGSGREPERAAVRLEVAGGVVSADGLAIRLLDEPDVGDLYNFCYAEPDQRPTPPAAIDLSGDEIDARWEGLRVIARIWRRTDEPFLRIEGVIRNDRADHRLRLVIDVGRAVDGSLAGSPFELVDRPLVGEGGDIEEASRTWPARHVVMAGSLAILHEGVFEYEVIGDRLAMTMLRCVGAISKPNLATRPFDAGPHVETPLAQMIGETSFAVGLWPEAKTDELLSIWERFALPLVEARAAGGGDVADRGSFMELGGDAQLSNIRRVGGQVEVRVWNPFKDREAVAIVGRSEEPLRPAEIRTIRAG